MPLARLLPMLPLWRWFSLSLLLLSTAAPLNGVQRGDNRCVQQWILMYAMAGGAWGIYPQRLGTRPSVQMPPLVLYCPFGGALIKQMP